MEWKVLLVSVMYLVMVTSTEGQGFQPSSERVVGATDVYSELRQIYQKSNSWRRSYKLSPVSTCSRSSSKSLCAAAAASDMDAYAQLMMAASPQVYSSLDPKYTSDVRLVAPPLDQQGCDTCSAIVVASAAETAMASAYQTSVADCSISAQALHFCPPGKQPGRTCWGGWTLESTVTLLVQYSQQLPTEACMPYKPDPRGELAASELCSSSCTAPNKYAADGVFSASQITTMWEAQLHIREFGAVVTRFDIMDDFRPFFNNYGNSQAVYAPKPGAKFVEGHAVVLVGYDNDQQYWVAKNSWGSGWADEGFFKVKYGVCSILTPDTGEAYGIVWTPRAVPAAAKLSLSAGPRAGCYWYKAHAGDYMSRIAWLAGIPLDTFMIDNAVYVKDLDAPLEGTSLIVCNPKPGRYITLFDPQLEALLRIKSAIDTTNQLSDWTRATGADAGYCKWTGIMCAPGKGFTGETAVWALELDQKPETVSPFMMSYMSAPHGPLLRRPLHGTLPAASAFSGLSSLGILIITNQPGITGTLPPDWPQLSQLYEGYLHNDALSGSIPSSWIAWKVKLSLCGNNLTGHCAWYGVPG